MLSVQSISFVAVYLVLVLASAFRLPLISHNNQYRRIKEFERLSFTNHRATIVSFGDTMSQTEHGDPLVPNRQLIIHWRGETDTGYSKPFRHLEFTSALEAVLGLCHTSPLSLQFANALNYTGEAAMTDVNVEHFNEAMQYLEFSRHDFQTKITIHDIARATERCSLVHAVYEVIASAQSLDELASMAIEDGGFSDMYKGGTNEKLTWCFRARNYREPNTSDAGREKRYGSRARSMALEKAGLFALTDLLIMFGGKVDLLEPDCKIYIFDGLVGKNKTLARRIASGPRTSIIAPATRICITTTPLCPIASFSLCNVARISNDSKILDPYAGSCAILLAAAMIAPSCQTVGIEIANNNIVNRDDIRKDFEARGLTLPKALLQGNCIDPRMRQLAQEAVGLQPFDVICADPPYGIRESTGFNENKPLEELFACISKDRDAGKRILNKGGRLVAFVPVNDEESLSEALPDDTLTEQAGLAFEVCREQPLNEKLSRWLVSFICIR